MTLSNIVKTALCRIYGAAAAVPKNIFPAKERAMLKGTGSLKKLPVYIKNKNIDNVLVVTDSAIKDCDIIKEFFCRLDELKIEYSIFADVNGKLTAQTAEKCAEEYNRSGCKALIAIGGGSAIDCAKLAGVKAAGVKNIEKTKGYKLIFRRLPPLFAVPTTVGSGSENSTEAVLFDKKQKKRSVISSSKLRPIAAVLDPLMPLSLSEDIIAHTAMAALCRAIEGYIASGTNKTTQSNAKLAVRLVFANALKASEKKDRDALAELQKASYLSGGKAGYAHYGALFLSAESRVSYACAAAALLPAVLNAYGEKGHKKLAELAESIKITGETDKEKAEKFVAAIEKLNEKLHIPSKIRGIKKKSIPKYAGEISARCNPYYAAPKPLFIDEISNILQNIKE